jgi:hypothetical protein
VRSENNPQVAFNIKKTAPNLLGDISLKDWQTKPSSKSRPTNWEIKENTELNPPED